MLMLHAFLFHFQLEVEAAFTNDCCPDSVKLGQQLLVLQCTGVAAYEYTRRQQSLCIVFNSGVSVNDVNKD